MSAVTQQVRCGVGMCCGCAIHALARLLASDRSGTGCPSLYSNLRLIQTLFHFAIHNMYGPGPEIRTSVNKSHPHLRRGHGDFANGKVPITDTVYSVTPRFVTVGRHFLGIALRRRGTKPRQ
mgnify:CR=1 FL=1